MFRNFSDQVERFRNSCNGAITVLNIFFLMVVAILGGVAIDMANLISARTQLQIAADVASHAALYERQQNSAQAAKEKAIEVARQNMPTSRYGDVLRVDNIHFGTYDKTAQQFKVDDTLTNAVYVATDRLAANANPVSSFLLQFIGYSEWDLVTTSVFEAYLPNCLMEGFVAEGPVDMQSNNTYYNEFCIHSNTHVEMNMGNVFETGVVVSMPDLSDFVMPESGYSNNTGIEAALIEQRLRIRILNRLDKVRDGVIDPDSVHFRKWISDTEIIPVTATKKLTAAMLEKGRMHRVTCSGASLDIAGELFQEVGIITDCNLQFSSGSHLIDATFITESTDDRSITASQGLILGRDDDCAEGGGAQLVTWGGVASASKLEFYGSQIIAAKDVSFAAQSNGIDGAMIISGGKIDSSSLANMRRCATGMEGNFTAKYFRLAG